jgi:amidophosphoribosyltransferase
VYPCPFLNFSASRSPLELITRRFIQQKEDNHDVNLHKYSDNTSEEHHEMIEYIRRELKLSSLQFNTIEDLVASIGLDKSSICTHCFDGTSYGN